MTNSGSEQVAGQSEPGYDYIREIGKGGYGYVYLFSRISQRGQEYVAGKFIYRHVFGLQNDTGTDSAYQRAFEGLQKFRSLTAESPYLLRIFDVRQRHDEGYFCYMMELADDLESGRQIAPASYKPKTLKNELERSGHRLRLPVQFCVEIAITLARGLHILHQGGFTHRDLRPSNIIFVDSVPKLADIDLLANDDAKLASYIPKEYAAPEGTHSSRADIFSFGKTLYEMSTGLPVKSFPILPFDIRHWEDHKQFLALNKLVGKATAYDLRNRYQSVKQMLRDLETIR
jgi:eukaryotic-like serine/threonine-protein kinase